MVEKFFEKDAKKSNFNNQMEFRKMSNIKIVPYNPLWPEIFNLEAASIKKAFGNNCIAIHHIGSTSVPGLNAKPIIDILPVVKNILEVDKATEAMKDLSYEVKGEHGIAFRRFFQKNTNISAYNVHTYEEGDPEIDRYLKFRDWMRSHKEDALSYAHLKIELAKKFPQDIVKYCNGKDDFVAGIDIKSGFNGWRMVKALTEREWSTLHRLRQNYFFELEGKSDPYTWTFEHKDHVHFVFYKNTAIIGYAHLQLKPEGKALLHMLLIDKPYLLKGFETQFLKLCERWLLHQGFKIDP